MPPKEIKYDLPRLTDSNYSVWEEHVKQCFYSNTWDAATTAAWDRAQDEAIPDANLTDAQNRAAWGKIYSTLPANVIQRVRDIEQGKIELLLAGVRDFYLKSSLASELRLEDELSSKRLHDFSDLTAYILWLENTVKTLEDMGHTVTERKKIAYLLNGLPEEFTPVKSQLLIQEMTSTVNWKQTIRFTAIFNEKVLPPMAKIRKAAAFNVNDDSKRQLCRLFSQTGSCRFGSTCKFVHTQPPAGGQTKWKPPTGTSCTYCRKPGTHVAAQCRKKIQDEAATMKSSSSTNLAAQADDAQTEAEEDQDIDLLFTLSQVSATALSTVSSHDADADSTWALDGGSTIHACFNRDLLFDTRPVTKLIKVASGATMTIATVGKALLGDITLCNVHYHPLFTRNLLSEQIFDRKGCTITKTGGIATVSRYGATLLVAKLSDHCSLYLTPTLQSSPPMRSSSPKLKADGRPMSLTLTPEFAQYTDSKRISTVTVADDNNVLLARQYATSTSTLRLWHERFSHVNARAVAKIIGCPYPSKGFFCRSCVEGKSTRYPMTKGSGQQQPRASRPYHTLWVDFIGPFTVPTIGQKRYALIIVDDFSRFVWLFLLLTQSLFLQFFSDFCLQLEASAGRDKVVSVLMSDGGPTFQSSLLIAFCARRGIIHIIVAPYSQYLNGVAERTIRSVVEAARTMLIHAGAAPKLLGAALVYAVYCYNRTPNRSTPGSTRLERLKQRQLPNAHKNLRVWGCAAWKLNHLPVGKHGPRALMLMHVGIDEHTMCYLLAEPIGFKIHSSAHVTFNEELLPCKVAKAAQSADDDHPLLAMMPPSSLPPFSSLPLPTTVPAAPAAPPRQRTPSPQCLRNIAEADSVEQVQLITDVACFMDEVFSTFQAAKIVPRSHRQAMKLPTAEKWRAAEVEEFKSHTRNRSLGPAQPLPAGYSAVPLAQVYKIKRCGRHKVRTVVRGYRLIPGIDFNQTFSPVPRTSTIRVFFAIVAKFCLLLTQFDVTTAFLASKMDTEVYVTLPQAFSDDPSIDAPVGDTVSAHLLLKAIPGLPQGGRLFFKMVDKAIVEKVGFIRMATESCIYKMPNVHVYMLIWVDDGLLASETPQQAAPIITALETEFDMVVTTDVHEFLGIKIQRDMKRRILTLSQPDAIDVAIAKADMVGCSPADTPVALGAVFTKQDSPVSGKHPKAHWYIMMVATMIFFYNWTRPDIGIAVSKLCKFMHNPGETHIKMLKRLVRYMSGTRDRGLKFDFSEPIPRTGLYGYFDAAHMDDLDTRRTTMGYLFFFDGCIISWFSKLHSSVTTSTNHSEYVAAFYATKESIALQSLFNDLGFHDEVSPVALFGDSQGAIAMAHNPVLQSATRHIEAAAHFTREQIQLGTIIMSYVRSADNLADAMTKPLSLQMFAPLVLCFVSP
jgi:hypothetical protein